MILEQIYLGCLSQASYLIADLDAGVAAVVDPRRDVDVYLERAKELGVKIEHAVLTHFHADFASGHLELKERCGATIYLGEGAAADYPFQALRDGQEIRVGSVTLRALATPGHTPESMCYLVFEPGAEAPHAVLTGDTLFIGDAGRPDLLGSVGRTAEEMAGLLYDSLRTRIMTLPPATIVYPGHGAGSMCGKNLSTEIESTIGAQLETNAALQPATRDEFIAMITKDQPTAPGYFAYDVGFNKRPHPVLAEAVAAASVGLAPADFLAARAAGAQVLDTREADAYVACHLHGSYNVGLSGKFATWAGTVLDPGTPIVAICEPGREEEVLIRLGRIGFDHVRGFLAGGFAALEAETAAAEHLVRASRVTAAELLPYVEAHPGTVLLDVRTPTEHAGGAIDGHTFIPMAELAGRVGELPAGAPLAIYCGGGYRSAIAMGVLERAGHGPLVDLVGGWTAWQEQFARS